MSMRLVEIDSLDTPGLEPYTLLTEAQLRNRLHEAEGLFIAESPKVINVALDAGWQPVSMLCERKHIETDAAGIIARCPEDIPLFTGSRELLASLTGYRLTRGVLCAMRRKKLPAVSDICKDAHRVVIIDSVTDTTNIGAIFRSAAALGIDAVLLTPTSCDPLNRRAVRVSMGSVFLVPWTWTDPSLAELKALDFKIAALALTDESLSIEDSRPASEPRLALRMGTEGTGLSHSAIDEADYVLRIPMSHHVDSLNVAAASALAVWQLRYRNSMRLS